MFTGLGPQEDIRIAEVVFDKTTVGLAFVSKDKKFIKCNEALCEFLEYPKHELLQKDFSDLTHPQDNSPDVEMVNRVLAGEIDSYQMSKRYLTRSGKSKWATLVVTALRDNKDEFLMFFSQIHPMQLDNTTLHEIMEVFENKIKNIESLLEKQKANSENIQHLQETIDLNHEESEKRYELQQDEKESTNSNIFTSSFISPLLKEWKWIAAFLVTAIGGIIAFETNRRINEFKQEQRFSQIEQSVEKNRRTIDDGINGIIQLLQEKEE